METNESDLPENELLRLVEDAYARRGLQFRERYPVPSKIMTINHSYFVYDRAYGGNWVLAGPTYCQVWWMAASAVGTSLVTAQVAERLLSEPVRVGRLYEAYMRDVLPMHEICEYFAGSRSAHG